jgi:hypothetical protein
MRDETRPVKARLGRAADKDSTTMLDNLAMSEFKCTLGSIG